MATVRLVIDVLAEGVRRRPTEGIGMLVGLPIIILSLMGWIAVFMAMEP
ncbi:hypothetical protein PQ455_10500 [Sphingomonas naphthae]|uniref:ABC transporter permease n=1 Tax=Sphingomonas naphthae TaxID=1813468 RepID=A0ABY7TFT8_9SPHN|nr:hypothetical protein [Sphingomonas naphthae]WCT72078.1 hypothetical protein PQ455_10500 [Sphingomonas naphthae]